VEYLDVVEECYLCKDFVEVARGRVCVFVLPCSLNQADLLLSSRVYSFSLLDALWTVLTAVVFSDFVVIPHDVLPVWEGRVFLEYLLERRVIKAVYAENTEGILEEFCLPGLGVWERLVGEILGVRSELEATVRGEILVEEGWVEQSLPRIIGVVEEYVGEEPYLEATLRQLRELERLAREKPGRKTMYGCLWTAGYVLRCLEEIGCPLVFYPQSFCRAYLLRNHYVNLRKLRSVVLAESLPVVALSSVFGSLEVLVLATLLDHQPSLEQFPDYIEWARSKAKQVRLKLSSLLRELDKFYSVRDDQERIKCKYRISQLAGELREEVQECMAEEKLRRILDKIFMAVVSAAAEEALTQVLPVPVSLLAFTAPVSFFAPVITSLAVEFLIQKLRELFGKPGHTVVNSAATVSQLIVVDKDTRRRLMKYMREKLRICVSEDFLVKWSEFRYRTSAICFRDVS